MSLFGGLFIAILLSFVIDMVLSLFISNPYLLQMVSSLLLAFVYSIIFLRGKRSEFYKNPAFYTTFGYTAALFLLFDMIMIWLGAI